MKCGSKTSVKSCSEIQTKIVGNAHLLYKNVFVACRLITSEILFKTTSAIDDVNILIFDIKLLM